MNSFSPLNSNQEFLIYTEVTENPPEPTAEEIREYAARIGIDVEKEPQLLFLAREGINHKLPPSWKPCLNKTRDVVFYFNEDTQESQWEHPMDPIYRDKVIQARAEHALNKIQSFDPMKRPPNKDLPPIKRTGGSLAPINPISNSLGKLSGFGSAAGELRQRTPPRNLNNDFNSTGGAGLSNNSNNNHALGRFNSGGNSNNIISGSSLNLFKDTTDDDEESSPSFIRPQPQKRIGGLTITGGGANFLKGSNPDGPTGGSKLAPLGSFKRDHEVSMDAEAGGEGDSDKKPIKSILVNSISRSRPKNPSDNIYELDGFSMNLDEMTDEEKMVVSQIESSTASKSKGNVKFNLDENTELKFEMDDEEEDDEIVEEVETDKTEEEEEESVSNRPSVEVEPVQNIKRLQHNGSGDQQDTRLSRNSSVESDMDVFSKRKIPPFNDTDIITPKKPSQVEVEKDINSFLQQEVQHLQSQLDQTLQQRRKELEQEHEKKMEELAAEYKRKEEIKIKELQESLEEKTRHTTTLKNEIQMLPEYSESDIAAMKKAMRDEMEAELNMFKEQLEEERNARKEQIQKHLEETIAQFKLEKDETLKRIRKDMDAEKVLEIEKAKREIESLLQGEVQELKTHFDESLQQKRQELEEEHNKKIEELTREYKKKGENKQKEILRQRSSEDQSTNKSEEKVLSQDSFEQSMSKKSDIQLLPEYSKADIAAMKKAMREMMEAELNIFKHLLEDERNARKEQIKKHLEDTVKQFQSEKEETLKRIRKDMDAKKELEIERAKKEIEGLLQMEMNEMKEQFNETLHQRRAELEKQHNKKIKQLSSEFRKRNDDSQEKSSEDESSKQMEDSKKHKETSSKQRLSLYPKNLSRSASAIPQDLRGSKDDLASEDTHQRIVEDAKAFIRMQKNRLKDPSPIPNSSHLILPTTKNNLLLFDEKLLKSVSPRRPASIHLDLVSETESSGVSSLKDNKSSERKGRKERKKLLEDIDDIYHSLNNLDQQMKLVWSVVKEKQEMQQQPYLLQDDTLSFLNASTTSSSDFLLPNTVPMILGKSSSARICASLPSSARKPLVPPPTPACQNNQIDVVNLMNKAELTASLNAGPRYSSLLTNNQSSSSQAVLDALRMSGLSTTRLDCADLLKSLEDELKEFKTTKQKMLEKGPVAGSSSLDRKLSITKQNNTSNILEKTKDLQEWLKKY